MIIIELYKWAPMAKGSKALNLLASGRFFFMPFYLANCLFFCLSFGHPHSSARKKRFYFNGAKWFTPKQSFLGNIFHAANEKNGKKTSGNKVAGITLNNDRIVMHHVIVIQ